MASGFSFSPTSSCVATLLLSGCAPCRVPPTEAPQPQTAVSSSGAAGDKDAGAIQNAREANGSGGQGDKVEGLRFYHDLVALVRRYHIFSPVTERNFGKRWDDSLPRLEAEFTSVHDSETLTAALWHFGNSLHDVHCQFRPTNRGERLRLGFDVAAEAAPSGFRFYVERVTDEVLRGVISAGDEVVTADGVAAKDFMSVYEFASNMNAPERIAGDVAHALTARRTSMSSVRGGATASWVVRPRAGGNEKSFVATWRLESHQEEPPIHYASDQCEGAESRTYGPYTLTSRGSHVCVYTSTAPLYRNYPIVRLVSFAYDYSSGAIVADHDLLVAAFRNVRPAGVVLDVQDNAGGMNPNVFLDWWAPAPYVDMETRMLLDDTILSGGPAGPQVSDMGSSIKAWYAAELRARRPGARLSSPRPFMCKSDTCQWNNTYTPSHRVVHAPLALLLGPGCASSCDAFAWHFARERMGPLVGRQPMAGLTTHRARFPVMVSPSVPPFGAIDLAVSYDSAPGSDESLEGAPLPLDVMVPRTFENSARYDALLVDTAIRALRTGPSGRR